MRKTMLAVSLTMMCGAAVAQAMPRYNVVLLPQEAFYTAAALNNHGTTLEWRRSVTRDFHTTFTSGHQVTNIGSLGGADTYGSDINDSGQVVGTAELANGRSVAFLYSSGTMKEIPTVGLDSSASKINNAGTVIGSYSTGSSRAGFIYSESNGLTYLQSEDYNEISVNDIDESGRVLGEAQDFNGKWRPFIYENGQMNFFSTPGDRRVSGFAPDGGFYGSVYSDWPGGWMDQGYVIRNGVTTMWGGPIRDMNASGYAVVTSSRMGSEYGHYVADPDGVMYDLDDLVDDAQWTTFNAVYGINDIGQVIASGCTTAGCYYMRLDPVPEPGTWAMLSAGLALVGFAARRRNAARAV